MLLRLVGLIALLFVLGCGTGPALQPVTEEAPPSGEDTAREAGDATGETEILYETSRDADQPHEAPRPLEEELDEQPDEEAEEPEEIDQESEEIDEESEEIDEEVEAPEDQEESQPEEDDDQDQEDDQDPDDDES